nr:FeoA family protein [Frisingicoccus sp.]
MPLTMARAGEEREIKRIGGRDEARRFLESLGFVVGAVISVVSEMNGNLIVNIKGSRVAISKEMANKIMI